jgi:hypothetical protein
MRRCCVSKARAAPEHASLLGGDESTPRRSSAKDAALAAELRSLKPSQLRRRAVELGVDEDHMAKAEDANDARGAIVAHPAESRLVFTDLKALFKLFDADGNGTITRAEMAAAAAVLGFPFESEEDADVAYVGMSGGEAQCSEGAFVAWWSNLRDDEHALRAKLHKKLSFTIGGLHKADTGGSSGVMFG